MKRETRTMEKDRWGRKQEGQRRRMWNKIEKIRKRKRLGEARVERWN